MCSKFLQAPKMSGSRNVSLLHWLMSLMEGSRRKVMKNTSFLPLSRYCRVGRVQIVEMSSQFGISYRARLLALPNSLREMRQSARRREKPFVSCSILLNAIPPLRAMCTNATVVVFDSCFGSRLTTGAFAGKLSLTTF